MSGFSGFPQIFDIDPYTQSSVQMHQIGTIASDKHGDLYRYSKVGASNISAGKMQSAPTQKTQHHGCAVVSAAAGQRKVNITLGSTAATVNEYAGGMLVINAGTGLGQTYRIVSHPAAGTSAALTLTVDQNVVTALDTTSKATLTHNRWNGVVEGTAITVRAAGVTLIAMTALYYGWLKTRGTVSCLIGSAATLGADLIISGTGGAVTDRTDALGASAEPVVGVADIVVGVTGEYQPIRLTID